MDTHEPEEQQAALPQEIDFTLRPCPYCQAPLSVVDGKVFGQAVLSVIKSQTMLTPHFDSCEALHRPHPLPLYRPMGSQR